MRLHSEIICLGMWTFVARDDSIDSLVRPGNHFKWVLIVHALFMKTQVKLNIFRFFLPTPSILAQMEKKIDSVHFTRLLRYFFLTLKI